MKKRGDKLARGEMKALGFISLSLTTTQTFNISYNSIHNFPKKTSPLLREYPTYVFLLGIPIQLLRNGYVRPNRC
jgi:hypothetical protein